MRDGDQRLRRGWDGSLGGSMDIFVCNILWWDEQYDLMIYLPLGMNRFFRKRKGFFFRIFW